MRAQTKMRAHTHTHMRARTHMHICQTESSRGQRDERTMHAPRKKKEAAMQRTSMCEKSQRLKLLVAPLVAAPLGPAHNAVCHGC